MLTLKELTSWFEELSKIIIDLNIAFNNLKEITSISESETVENIKRNGFFLHHRFQLRFIIAIQLSKVYSSSPSQRIRINQLLKRLKSEEFDKELNNKIEDNKKIPTLKIDNEILPKVFTNREQINTEIELFYLRLKENRKSIKKIEDSRNKIYAHSDPKIEKFIPRIEIDEFEKLVILTNDFYNTFRGRMFDIHTDFRTGDWSVKYVLNIMALQLNNRRKKN
ncbi:MAG: hypothetical protein KQH67_05160 [Bacteroidetes bacterium]|nr:hypothetical protein [Bacteroidota bacterium]